MNKSRRKGKAGCHLPKTPSALKRKIEKVERKLERLRRELADAVKAEYERSVGGMLLAILEKKRSLADEGDEQAQRSLDCWMEHFEAAVTGPAGLDAEELPEAQEAILKAALAHLNRERIRCTYGALGDLLGVAPYRVGKLLGTRQPEVSWVVNHQTGLPTGYRVEQMHRDLLCNTMIIRDVDTLRAHLGWAAAEPDDE